VQSVPGEHNGTYLTGTERETEMRQPEVSRAMKYLVEIDPAFFPSMSGFSIVFF
jgi:hypothetical protein